MQPRRSGMLRDHRYFFLCSHLMGHGIHLAGFHFNIHEYTGQLLISFGIDYHSKTADHAALLHVVDPFPDCYAGQMDLLGNVRIRASPVAL